MLSLTRKPNEAVRIGETVVVNVGRIKGGRVTLRIEAPSDVPIHRAEVFAEIGPKPGPPRLRRCIAMAATFRGDDHQIVGTTEVYPDRQVSHGTPCLTPDGELMGWSADGAQCHDRPGQIGKLYSRWLWRAER